MDERSTDLAGLRILIIEDEVLVAMLIEDMLHEFGCKVVGTIATVEAAMTAVEQNSFDGVLMDSNLNGKSVRPVVETLNARAVPFAVITGYDQSDLSRLPLHNTPVLRKPFRVGQLSEVMRSFAASQP